MESTRSSSKGQMVIPKLVREALGIRSGTELEVELLPGKAFKVSVRSTDHVARVLHLAGMLAHRGRRMSAAHEAAAIMAAVLADDQRTKSRTRRRR
ncbi:MAG: AbrB/MazE/SpoVT family DNA-binding domain-containing protein [Betaproteobacteria bacterium]|nr:AbrB/MazE/SpoVT family DNA-binding domain-containing protein [Betaproteobacteria bacterium]